MEKREKQEEAGQKRQEKRNKSFKPPEEPVLGTKKVKNAVETVDVDALKQKVKKSQTKKRKK